MVACSKSTASSSPACGRNLYATSDNGLVWSGHSSTVDPDSVEEGIDSVTQAVAAKLREEGLIR